MACASSSLGAPAEHAGAGGDGAQPPGGVARTTQRLCRTHAIGWAVFGFRRQPSGRSSSRTCWATGPGMAGDIAALGMFALGEPAGGVARIRLPPDPTLIVPDAAW